MRAGNPDRRVTLSHLVLTRDATTGEQVESYVAYDTVWASKRDAIGPARFAAQQVHEDGTTLIRVRWRTDTVVTDRLMLDSVVYNIKSIAEIGRHEGLELACTTVGT